MHYETCTWDSDAGTGGARRATAPPPNIWQISQPFSNRGGQIIPTYYYWHPQCFSPSSITGCQNQPHAT